MMQNDIYHIIKDPVHGSMQFNTEEDSWIKPLIDSENFQRLRHIKQLGLADFVFPGAVHTRFNHSLGCCYVASQISKKLNLSTEDKRTVMLACLLHDIGHGPFSHAFEHLFYKKSIQHEDWTLLFVDDYAKQKLLDSKTLKNIKELIQGDDKKHSLLSDIVSSQLDADRLDYLLRDSHFCGVNYGEYDFRWLLHCLTIVRHNGKDRLGITRKGIGTVEHYLMARRLMVRNVYQHEKKHGAEFLLSMFLQYLAKAVLEEGLFEGLKENRTVIFLNRVFRFNEATKKTKNSEALKKEFLIENFDLYKNLCDYDIYSLIRFIAHQDIKHPVVEIAKRLQGRKNPKVINVPPENIEKVKARIEKIKQKNKSIQDWQLGLLTLPHLSYEINNDPILVADYNGKTTFLHDDSLIVKSISDKTENAHVLCIDIEICSGKIIDELLAH